MAKAKKGKDENKMSLSIGVEARRILERIAKEEDRKCSWVARQAILAYDSARRRKDPHLGQLDD